jgi:hypothetical protein
VVRDRQNWVGERRALGEFCDRTHVSPVLQAAILALIDDFEHRLGPGGRAPAGTHR